jgi:hypothetical protein
VQLSKARIDSERSKAMTQASLVISACELAGKPELAQAYVERGTSLSTVLSELSASVAAGPAESGDSNAALLTAAKRIGDEERSAMRQRHTRLKAAGVTVLVEV